MSKILTLSIITFLFFSCSSENAETETQVVFSTENSTKVNLAIGIKKDADLREVFNTLNELKFDILQMNGFFFHSNTPKSGIENLINTLNEKPYIKTGAWAATPHSVFYMESINKTHIGNVLFNMDVNNQNDFLELISSLKWEDGSIGTKNIYLGVPIGSHTYWKTEMKKYSFVTFTETFDQVCLSYRNASVISAQVPASGQVNQTIPIKIKFNVDNGCGSFSSISETNLGNTKTITIKAKYEGCFCTMNIPIIETTYNFTARTAGNYTLKFSKGDGSYVIYAININ
ncbi:MULTISPECIES: hypothetical protein [Flavobacterium]|uniref:hypothetical protein n=1 Tax=Flavobacterium TaxID=237 RepID=UPI0011840B88|nr:MULTISPECIES: hypothetical protein [Flavobacterium]MCR4031515.1 hypothetical protein [Flavobacterium panacis]